MTDATDLTKITTPFGLLGPQTKAALTAHGGPYEIFTISEWREWTDPAWAGNIVYRVKPAALIPDSIDWSHVAPQLKWMARDESGSVFVYDAEPRLGGALWSAEDGGWARIDIVLSSYRRGTVDWRDSLVRRPE